MTQASSIDTGATMVSVDAALLRAIVQGPASGTGSTVDIGGGVMVRTLARVAAEASGPYVRTDGAAAMAGNLDMSGTVAGNIRSVHFQTSGSNRWVVGPSFDAEAGGSVGSNFNILRFDDAGAFAGTPFEIDRATGAVHLEHYLAVANSVRSPVFHFDAAGAIPFALQASGYTYLYDGGVHHVAQLKSTDSYYNAATHTFRLADESTPAPVAHATPANTAAGTESITAAFVGASWIGFTPTLTAGSGTITTVGAVTGRYKRMGKLYLVEYALPITTNGTGAAFLVVDLPNGALAAAYGGNISGCEVAINNKMVQGRQNPGSNALYLFNADGTYPGLDGATIVASGLFEAA